MRDGEPCFDAASDTEGFSAAAGQFDSDITQDPPARESRTVVTAVVFDANVQRDR